MMQPALRRSFVARPDPPLRATRPGVSSSLPLSSCSLPILRHAASVPFASCLAGCLPAFAPFVGSQRFPPTSLPASLPASATRSAPGPRRGFPELRGRESWTRSLPPTSIWHGCAAVARRKTSTKKGRACMMARAADRRGALLTHGAAGPAWPLFRTQTPHTYEKRVDCPKTCTSRFF